MILLAACAPPPPDDNQRPEAHDTADTDTDADADSDSDGDVDADADSDADTDATPTGATGGTGDTGYSCPGFAPLEVFVDDEYAANPPVLATLASWQGKPGGSTICSVSCDDLWAEPALTAPASLDPLLLPYVLAEDELVELLVDVAESGGDNESHCLVVGGESSEWRIRVTQ